MLGPATGAENDAGVLRYGALGVYAVSDVYAVQGYLLKGNYLDDAGAEQTAADTTVTVTAYAAAGAVTVPATDASTWPQRGHVWNTDSDEILMFRNRSGNSLFVDAAGRGMCCGSDNCSDWCGWFGFDWKSVCH